MECKHAKRRTLIQSAINTHTVQEMYERYERERREGKYRGKLDPDPWWRQMLRQEVDRARRLGT